MQTTDRTWAAQSFRNTWTCHLDELEIVKVVPHVSKKNAEWCRRRYKKKAIVGATGAVKFDKMAPEIPKTHAFANFALRKSNPPGNI